MKPKRFKSKVDAWFYLTIVGSVVIVLAVLLAVLESPSTSELAMIAAAMLLAVGLPVWVLLQTHYTVTKDALVIRSGPMRWTVPLDEIKSVTTSRSLLSSPALSMDRLEITWGGFNRILVSPEDRRGFLKAIGQQLSDDS